MDHFYQNIQGWFDYGNFLDEMVNHFPSGSHFVEVGAWLGSSAAYMGVAIINSGKDIKFDSVDTWLGSPEHTEFEDVINGTLYESFLKNIAPVAHVVNPIRLPSVEAAKLYADQSLDFVFIDAEHSYESVVADIKAWLPKMKPTGMLAGHDYMWDPVRRAVNDTLPAAGGQGSWAMWMKDAPQL